jgi:hypothetical protein
MERGVEGHRVSAAREAIGMDRAARAPSDPHGIDDRTGEKQANRDDDHGTAEGCECGPAFRRAV